jgi:hypothetical protein
MDLVELGARSIDLVDLEFLELRCLAGKKWSGVVLLDLEFCGALPNTPLTVSISLMPRPPCSLGLHISSQER